MKRVLKVFTLSLLLTMAIIPIFANGSQEMKNSSAKKQLTLSIWDENQKATIQEIVDSFNAQSTEYEATIQLTPWSTYWTKLDASAGAGDAADVFWMNVYLPKYVDGDVLLPLDEYITKNDIDINNYVQTTLDMYNYKNHIWAMPKGMDTVVVAYNKALFDKYDVAYPQKGWSWDDMKTISMELRDKIKKAGDTNYPILMELDAQPSYFNFIYQNGGYVVSDDYSKSGFNQPEVAKSFQNVVDLFNEKLLAPYNVLSETKGTDLFISKKGAMVFIGSWKASVLENCSIAQEGNLGLVTMPSQDVDNTSVIGGLGYAISKNTKYPDGSFALVKYLTGFEGNKIQGEKGIDIPAYRDAQKYYKEHFKNIDAQAFFDAADTSVPFPAGPDINAWIGIINDNAARILAQEISPEKGCELIYKDMQAAIDK